MMWYCNLYFFFGFWLFKILFCWIIANKSNVLDVKCFFSYLILVLGNKFLYGHLDRFFSLVGMSVGHLAVFLRKFRNLYYIVLIYWAAALLFKKIKYKYCYIHDKLSWFCVGRCLAVELLPVLYFPNYPWPF